MACPSPRLFPKFYTISESECIGVITQYEPGFLQGYFRWTTSIYRGLSTHTYTPTINMGLYTITYTLTIYKALSTHYTGTRTTSRP